MKFQREFFSLAGQWLASRLLIMGGDVEEQIIQNRHQFEGAMQWQQDVRGEMKMLCREALK